MIQIDDVVISLDVFREKFLCNLDACKGECCIEGDAGAPVELDEVEKLEEVLPVIWDELSPEARTVIDKQGVVYTDEEGDLVTSIVNQKDCVFTCYDEKGYCYCAIEKAFRAGKTDFYKPISCHLYPIRIGDYGPYKAVKAIDECVKDTVEAAKANDYEVIIIADHGNADHALNEDGTPNTAHSLNPVPFVYVTENKNAKVENGVLADVAPSILHILGMPQPADMTGRDLIK